MKIVFNKKEYEEVYIYPIGDVHIGSAQCNLELFKKDIQYISKQPANHRVILVGDILENATRYSVGAGVYEQEYHPEDQLDIATKLLQPVRARIDGMVSGNHENRTKKEVGIDISRILADRLKIKNKYNPAQVLVNYNIAGYEFHIFAFHGAGGGGSIGNIVNKSIKKKEIYGDADVYVSGHVHVKASHVGIKTRIHDKQIIYDHQGHVIVGSYLKYGGYGAEAGHTPQASGLSCIRMYVENETKKLQITI